MCVFVLPWHIDRASVLWKHWTKDFLWGLVFSLMICSAKTNLSWECNESLMERDRVPAHLVVHSLLPRRG